MKKVMLALAVSVSFTLTLACGSASDPGGGGTGGGSTGAGGGAAEETVDAGPDCVAACMASGAGCDCAAECWMPRGCQTNPTGGPCSAPRYSVYCGQQNVLGAPVSWCSCSINYQKTDAGLVGPYMGAIGCGDTGVLKEAWSRCGNPDAKWP